MAAISLAIVGKNNTPLYIREFLSDDGSENNKETYDDDAVLFGWSDDNTIATTNNNNNTTKCSTRQLFLLHAALDRLEQLTTTPVSGRKINTSNFLGLLLPREEERVYGYITNTNIKFILIIDDDGPQFLDDVEIQRLLTDVHDLYIKENIMNPFCDVGIQTNSLSDPVEESINNLFRNFNQSDGMI